MRTPKFAKRSHWKNHISKKLKSISIPSQCDCFILLRQSAFVLDHLRITHCIIIFCFFFFVIEVPCREFLVYYAHNFFLLQLTSSSDVNVFRQTGNSCVLSYVQKAFDDLSGHGTLNQCGRLAS